MRFFNSQYKSKTMKNVLLSLVISITAVNHVSANTLDALLEKVHQSNRIEAAVDSQALAEFKANLTAQKSLLQTQQVRNKKLQQQMQKLQDNIAKGNTKIRQQQKRANDEKADLDKVFSEFRRASQDLRGQLKKSAISASLPGRSAQLAPFSEANFQADLPAMKKLWLLFTEQMVASSKVQHLSQAVIMPDGEKQNLPITQVAGFTAFTEQGALIYSPSNESYQLLANMPTPLQQRIQAFDNGVDGYIAALVDPSAGALLQRAATTTPWWQIFSDAGSVGALIVIVGVIGLIIGVSRWLILNRQAQQINLQKQDLQHLNDNALGRILSVANKHECSNADELARFLDEAILAELPACRKGLGSLAVLAAVAPLLGLLGTVAGMIETFQAITAYGNSDPQVLSSGISQALLTTKFGLIAAVPLMLLHSLLSSKSDTILHVIEHQSAGLLAQRQVAQRLDENVSEVSSQPAMLVSNG